MSLIALRCKYCNGHINPDTLKCNCCDTRYLNESLDSKGKKKEDAVSMVLQDCEDGLLTPKEVRYLLLVDKAHQDRKQKIQELYQGALNALRDYNKEGT